VLTLYNNAGVVINTDYTYCYYGLLLPGQKSPFKLLMISGPVDYVTRRLSTQASVTTDVPPNLRSMNVTHYTDGLGWLHFAGQVQNLGSTSLQYEEAFLTLYDASGKILNCDRDYLTPTTLPAGGTGVFEFILFDHFAGWATYSIYPPESVAQPTATPTQTTLPSFTPTATATRTATASPTSTTPGLVTPTATATASPTPSIEPTPMVTDAALTADLCLPLVMK